MAGGFAPIIDPNRPQIGLQRAPTIELPTSTVELSIRAEDLSDLDYLTKSDPVCIMYRQERGQWFEAGRTEMISNDLNPNWHKKFIVNYSFEERQVVKFEVYDWDSDSLEPSLQDFLGRVETTLGAIVSSSSKQFVSVLKDSPKQMAQKKSGKIFITAEELEVNKENLIIQFEATKVDKKDLFGKSDPFFTLSRASSSSMNNFVVVYRSEVIKNTLNPKWRPFTMKVRDLCNNDYDRALKIEIYDWNMSGTSDYIGSFKTTLRDLQMAHAEQIPFDCINEKKKEKKKNYKNSGVVSLKSFLIEKDLSFLDYIQGGTQMNFSVAIDFTGSNGHPQHPDSLHYQYPGRDNCYTTAIKSVGEIIEDYDSDKLFPALGFGAKVPPTNKVSHEFYVNLTPDNPFCAGVNGLLEAYYRAINAVQLYGPTNFSPVIRHTTKFAQQYQDGSNYFVLLIITDGIITDMEATMDAIIAASSFPISIIIVGVGNADFSAMDELDSDDKLLKHNGRVAARDIVQFVELKKYLGAHGYWNKELLAKEVLAQIPGQVVGWMKMRGIKPLNMKP